MELNELIEQLQADIAHCDKFDDPPDGTSYQFEEGILLSPNQGRAILSFLQQLKGIEDSAPSDTEIP